MGQFLQGGKNGRLMSFFLKVPNCLLTQLIALFNLSALEFSLVVFHDKAKRTQQGNLLLKLNSQAHKDH